MARGSALQDEGPPPEVGLQHRGPMGFGFLTYQPKVQLQLGKLK